MYTTQGVYKVQSVEPIISKRKEDQTKNIEGFESSLQPIPPLLLLNKLNSK
jgi:hypothetical protein